MFCQNCGTKNNDASVFCENCGAKLEKPVQPAQPTQPVQPAQPVQPTQPVQPVKPAKPRKPISKVWIVVAVEAVALIAAVVVFFKIGNDIYSPEKVAEKFFVEVANHNFKEAYKTLDVEEDDFINEKNFENASCNMELSKVTNYKIKRSRGSDSLGKDIEISYRTKGGSSTHSYNVSVSKKTGKNALFFEKWEVSPESMIVEDFYVDIPVGAEVTVDGVKLDEEYADKKNSTDTIQSYKIPAMFAGEHQIVVTKEGMKEVRKIVDTDMDYGYSLYNMSPDEEVLEEVLKTASSDLKEIYCAAAEGKDFDAVADLFSKDEDYQEDAKEEYENLVTDLLDNEYTTLNKLSFSNLEGEAYLNYWDEESVEVYFRFDYVAEYTEHWFGEDTNESYDDTSSVYLNFVYEDGKWVLMGFDAPYIYY